MSKEREKNRRQKKGIQRRIREGAFSMTGRLAETSGRQRMKETKGEEKRMVIQKTGESYQRYPPLGSVIVLMDQSHSTQRFP